MASVQRTVVLVPQDFVFFVDLLKVKSSKNVTSEGFDAIAKVYENLLPRLGLPKSFYEMKQYMKVFGLGYEKIDFCKNNCALF